MSITNTNIIPYARFSNRLNHNIGTSTEEKEYSATLIKDIAIQKYFRKRKTCKGNDGHLSKSSIYDTVSAAKNFLKYINRPITDHAIIDLVNFKLQNPLSTTIESAVEDYGTEEPIKHNAKSANRIIGIFRDNHAPLACSVSNHFDPEEEDCSTDHFLDTFEAMQEEAQDAIQWNVYYPQRATACYQIPLTAFKTFGNYAIAWVEKHSEDYSNKTRVKHPAIIPLAFFNKVKQRAELAGRDKPFPNYASLYKWKITAFCRQEFNEKFVSNRGRKFFEQMADKALMSPAIAAFLMGDRTKLAKTGHLPDIYNPALQAKELNNLIEEYQKVEPYLNLKWRGNPPKTPPTKDAIRAEIRRLQSMLGDETV